MDYPIKNDYEITIIVKNYLDRIFYWRKKVITFREWTISDLLDFENIKADDQKVIKRLKNILKMPVRCFVYDIWTILSIIIDNMFVWVYKSIQVWSQSKNNSIAPFSSLITFVSKEINTTPHDIIYNYTMRELEYLCEWIIRNLNEKTEEWQKINKNKSEKNTNTTKKTIDFDMMEKLNQQMMKDTQQHKKPVE